MTRDEMERVMLLAYVRELEGRVATQSVALADKESSLKAATHAIRELQCAFTQAARDVKKLKAPNPPKGPRRLQTGVRAAKTRIRIH